MNSDARKPRARYAVFSCRICAGGMTVGRDTRSRARRTAQAGEGARRDERAWGAAAVRALWKWAAQNITGVGDEE
jgi:hypothetical protein